MKWAAILLSASLAAQTLHSPPASRTSKAESWSEAVAKFVTDPHFYRQVPLDQLKDRYLPLMPGNQLTMQDGSGYGSNLEMGILYLFTNQQSLDRDKPVKIHHGGIEQLLLVLPRTDPDGNELYPLLKAKLQRQLRKPAWNLIRDKNTYFWRKGKTHYVVSLDLNDFFRPEAKLPGPGPYVIVDAAYEEGDSEEP